MKIPSVFLSLALVAASSLSHASEHPKSEHPKSEHPTAGAAHAKVLGLAFHADWCPTCKALAPTLRTVKPEFEDRIKFVKLDLTNDDTRAEAAETANKLGVSEIFQTHSGKTGFVLLVGAQSHQVLQTLTADMDADAMRAAMNAALRGTAAGGGEHPKSEHPKSEHPRSEHPKSEHPKSEHPSS